MHGRNLLIVPKTGMTETLSGILQRSDNQLKRAAQSEGFKPRQGIYYLSGSGAVTESTWTDLWSQYPGWVEQCYMVWQNLDFSLDSIDILALMLPKDRSDTLDALLNSPQGLEHVFWSEACEDGSV